MNKIRKKRLLGLTVGIAAIVVLFLYLYVLTFSYQPSQSVVKLFYVDNISDTHQKLIDRFNAQYAGQIEVVPVNLPFSKFSTNERKEILARSLRSKSERIDVFAVDIIWTQRFAKWSLPLDAYFDDQWMSRFLEQSVKTCYFKDRLVAAPLYLDVGLLYYREDLLQDLPDYPQIKHKLDQRLSWREFIRLGQRFKGTNHPIFLFPANNFEGLMCVFYELLTPEQIAATFLSDSINLHRPEIRQALEHLHRLIYTYRLTPPVVTGFDEVSCYNYLLEKNGVFVRGWPGFEFSVQAFNQQHQTDYKINFTAIPYFKTPETKAIYGGWNLMISENSQHPREALTFIRYMQKSASQKLLFTSGHYLPALKSVYTDSLLLTEFPQLQTLHRLLLDGQHRPMRSDYTRISDILSYYFHQALKNEISIDQALELAEKEINSQKIIFN